MNGTDSIHFRILDLLHLRRDEGLDFMKFSVYLLIWVVYVFTLPHYSTCLAKKKIVMEFFFYVVKYRFSVIPKCLFRWNNPCNAAHLHFFSWYFFAANFFLMLGGCYCRLPARMFIWLVVESISIWYMFFILPGMTPQSMAFLWRTFSPLYFFHTNFIFSGVFLSHFLTYSLETSHNTSW